MNILFEEDGVFRAGKVLVDNVTSRQVELAGGRRVKVKAAHILLNFEEPSPLIVIEQAHQEAQTIETEFLWEVCGDEEFSFADLAQEYAGKPADTITATAVLMKLFSAPIYFHRKGRGRFRRAPAEILKQALAGLERKREQAALIEKMASALEAGQLPAEFVPLTNELLFRPDRNRVADKALEAAASRTGKSAAQVLCACKALVDARDFHMWAFLFSYFPDLLQTYKPLLPATDSSTTTTATDSEKAGQYSEIPGIDDPKWEIYPIAPKPAFSIDDAQTSEIDDAFSLAVWEQPNTNVATNSAAENEDAAAASFARSGYRVGIHIAAPALFFEPDSSLDILARSRLSTVYLPGEKITMLPTEVIAQSTLAQGKLVPALSLYLDVAADGSIVASNSRLERVHIAANLRIEELEPLFNESTIAAGLTGFAWQEELSVLFTIAKQFQAVRLARGAKNHAHRADFYYRIDWTQTTTTGLGQVFIATRERGSPLDTLVSEFMIAANATWGSLLRDHGVVGMYRNQQAGKARMTEKALAHVGLGIDCYAWASSPLRRYSDLINQWQIISCLQNQPPPFTLGEKFSALLFDFELRYTHYAEFQRRMERYWSLRALLQDEIKQLEAVVLRENIVRSVSIPLLLRAQSLPAGGNRGRKLRLQVERVDLWSLEATVRFSEWLAPESATSLALGAESENETNFEMDMAEEAELADSPEGVEGCVAENQATQEELAAPSSTLPAPSASSAKQN